MNYDMKQVYINILAGNKVKQYGSRIYFVHRKSPYWKIENDTIRLLPTRIDIYDKDNNCEMNPIFHQLYLDMLRRGHTLKQRGDFIKQSNGWAFIIGYGKLLVE